MNYKEFKKIGNKWINSKIIDEYILKKITENHEVLTSDFNILNPRENMLKSLNQSLEIKMGYILEDVMISLFKESKFKIYESKLITDFNEKLNVDAVIGNKNLIYVIEFKKRDNHDSTKYRGQLDNLIKKTKEINFKYKNKKIISIIAFFDETYGRKNYNAYFKRWVENPYNKNNQLRIMYQKEVFDYFFNKSSNKIYNQFLSNMKKFINEEIKIKFEMRDSFNFNEIKLELQQKLLKSKLNNAEIRSIINKYKNK